MIEPKLDIVPGVTMMLKVPQACNNSVVCEQMLLKIPINTTNDPRISVEFLWMGTLSPTLTNTGRHELFILLDYSDKSQFPEDRKDLLKIRYLCIWRRHRCHCCNHQIPCHMKYSLSGWIHLCTCVKSICSEWRSSINHVWRYIILYRHYTVY